MKSVNLKPKPNTPAVNFYVLAPQTDTPQGFVPVLHYRVIGISDADFNSAFRRPQWQ